MKSALVVFLIAIYYVMAPVVVLANDTIGAFVLVQRKDKFSDEDRSYIYAPGQDMDGDLSFMCMEDGLNVVVYMEKYMVGDRYEGVIARYRIDNNPPSEGNEWGLLNGNEAAFIPDAQVLHFTREAMNGSSIVIEITDPFDGVSVHNRYSLAQLSTAVKKLSCAGEL